MTMAGSTLFDKIWDAHVVQQLPGGWVLLHVDRHLLHDLSGTAGLRDLAERKVAVRNPELALATPDHAVSSVPGRTGDTFAGGFIGYLAYSGDTSFKNMKTAIIVGLAMASFCVEKFGPERMQTLTREDINSRIREFVELAHFGMMS